MKMGLSKIMVMLMLAVSSIFGAGIISFDKYDKSEFSLVTEHQFRIPFSLSEKAKVFIDIYTPDGNKIRTLTSAQELKKGKHFLSWNGKDDTGTVVPNEAYVVVLKAKNKSGTYIDDPRTYSGGEIETNLHTKMTFEGKTIYKLSKPSRVLIRAGIKDGPMMRSLINWRPKPAGENIQHWNGYDEDKVVNVLDTKKYGVIVVAFSLPSHSIIVTGNKNLSYAKYYKEKHLEFKPVPLKQRLLERNGKGISPHYYNFRITDRDPKIDIKFPDSAQKTKNGISVFKNDQPVPITVLMSKEDEEFMEQSKYEVSFFVDFDFKSEEELGYMPITWLWSPNGLSKGKHILSVNISGFSGQVGVENIEFIIK